MSNSHILYPIGVLTNNMMRQIVAILVDHESVTWYMALGDGGTIPPVTPNPTLSTSILDTGKMVNEYARNICSLKAANVLTPDDSLLVESSWVCPAILDGQVLNEIGIYDDLRYGDLMFYGWPSINKSRFNIIEQTLVAGDAYTFNITITPASGLFI